jgi:hypothetical protein
VVVFVMVVVVVVDVVDVLVTFLLRFVSECSSPGMAVDPGGPSAESFVIWFSPPVQNADRSSYRPAEP